MAQGGALSNLGPAPNPPPQWEPETAPTHPPTAARPPPSPTSAPAPVSCAPLPPPTNTLPPPPPPLDAPDLVMASSIDPPANPPPAQARGQPNVGSPGGLAQRLRARQSSLSAKPHTPTPTERRMDASAAREAMMSTATVDTAPSSPASSTEAADPSEIPEEFLCPITRDLMSDPVLLGTGQTYERSSIRQWIQDGKKTCPVTGQALNATELTPNFALRHAIERWATRHAVELAPPEPMPSPRVNGSTTVTVATNPPGAQQRLPQRSSAIMQAVVKLYRGNGAAQDAAARVICQIANDGGDAGRVEIAEAGAIPPLISLLAYGAPALQEVACKAIRFLGRSQDQRVTLPASCAIPYLVRLLIHGNIVMQQLAAGALVNLSAKTDCNKFAIAAAGAIAPLVAMLDPKHAAGSPNAQEVAAAALCNLSVDDVNRIEIAAAGAVPLLVEVARTRPTPEAGEYAAHALGSLSCENEYNTLAIVRAGAVPVLVSMVDSGTVWAQEAAARALRNLSYNESVKPVLISAGAVASLVPLSERGSQRAKDAARTALVNLRPLTSPRNLSNLSIQVPAM